MAQEQIPLQATSDQGTFIVEIIWIPHDIGSAHTFDISFIEPETREEIEDVVYDFSIYNDGFREVIRRDQITTRQEFTFDEPGSYSIRIEKIEGLGEGASVQIQVTPEFPLGGLVLMAIAFGASVMAIRLNRNSLFRQPTK